MDRRTSRDGEREILWKESAVACLQTGLLISGRVVFGESKVICTQAMKAYWRTEVSATDSLTSAQDGNVHSF
jgi:hypothetical protein